MADIKITLKSEETGDNVYPNIVEDNIPEGAIKTPKINDGSVTTDKLANGSVTNDKIADSTIAYEKLSQALKNLIDGKASETDLETVQTALSNHTSNTSNPHSVTKSQVGLGNVDNTSDVNKPISTATQNALNYKQDKLTAGTNITIDENNVISASGGGGGSQLYLHNVLVYLDDPQGNYVGNGYFYIIIINNSNSAIDTLSKLYANSSKIVDFQGYDSDPIQSNFGINPISLLYMNTTNDKLEILFEFVDNGKLNTDTYTFDFNYDLDSIIPL